MDASEFMVSKSFNGSLDQGNEASIQGLKKLEANLQIPKVGPFGGEEAMLNAELHEVQEVAAELRRKVESYKQGYLSDPLVNTAVPGKKSKHQLTLSDHAIQGPHQGRPSVSQADHDLQRLENSIKFFDLYKASTLIPHSLRSTSSRYTRPDLESVEDMDILKDRRHHGRSLSFSAARTPELATASAYSPINELKSANKLPDLDHDGITRSHLLNNRRKKDNTQLSTLSTASSADQENPCAYDHKETTSHSLVDAGLLETTTVRNDLNIRSLRQKLLDPAKLQSEEFGPDELSRYLEALDLDETYVDAIMDTEGTPNQCVGTTHHFENLRTHKFNSQCILSAKDIPFPVDWVEVVGARQRKGGLSVWRRMVGVKDHTVYSIKVVSGRREWEVLRRYRDFVTLYRQMKLIFSDGTTMYLPLPSEDVQTDSRNVFSNVSPNVVEARSLRIERFLQSLVRAGPPFSMATPFFWFLYPPHGAFEVTGLDDHLMVSASSSLPKSMDVRLDTLDPSQAQPTTSTTQISKSDANERNHPLTIGKTIKLVLMTHDHESLKQVLHAQHHCCAGCYKHLDLGKGLIQGFAQTLGRGRPRFCEYTGQLFCSSCHSNDFAVLPAYVLLHWDFTPRRVSQLAKSYLDAIYDQPLLCITTVNPYLYQRVPILSTLRENRTKISSVLSCMRCSSRARIQQTMGSRRYLLENNDFFALRDLEDLSKGAFAVLPGLLKAILKTLKLHATKQCSICQDSGEWCSAGILCQDPFQPIFPFDEEAGVTRCELCNAPFHIRCAPKCSPCPACPKDWVGDEQITARQKV